MDFKSSTESDSKAAESFHYHLNADIKTLHPNISLSSIAHTSTGLYLHIDWFTGIHESGFWNTQSESCTTTDFTDHTRGELEQLGYIQRVGYRFAPSCFYLSHSYSI